MTGGSDDAPRSLSGAPIDFDRLDVIRERLTTDGRIS